MYTFPFSDIRMHISACTCVYVCLYFFTAGCFAWPPGTDTHPKKGLSFTNSDIQRGICSFGSFVPIEYEIYHVKHELNIVGKKFYISLTKYEPRYEKTAFLHMKTKMQITCAVTAQLISAFVFAIRIVPSLYYLNPKFQA